MGGEDGGGVEGVMYAVVPIEGLLEGFGLIMSEKRVSWMERGGQGRDVRA